MMRGQHFKKLNDLNHYFQTTKTVPKFTRCSVLLVVGTNFGSQTVVIGHSLCSIVLPFMLNELCNPLQILWRGNILIIATRFPNLANNFIIFYNIYLPSNKNWILTTSQQILNRYHTLKLIDWLNFLTLFYNWEFETSSSNSKIFMYLRPTLL